MMVRLCIILFAVVLLGAGCGAQEQGAITATDENGAPERGQAVVPTEQPVSRVDFSQYNPAYRFSAELPEGFTVEYVTEIESVNVYNPSATGDSMREQSQLFIRYFEASSFLTLQTVNILNREETSVNGHNAVRYEIEKKFGVANFPHQPSWRNARHKLTDIRYQEASPSYFYVFSRNPDFDEAQFEAFVQSLIFYNDAASFVPAIDDASARVTKKPFGTHITKENSPVQPERFSGFHTGTDYETFASEQGIDVPVYAICGGEVVEKRTASGYGGVVVQACEHEGQAIRVVYGHISLSSVNQRVGEYLVPGEQIALLGEEGTDTDNERKHLHLGIKKGASNDIRGYVASEAELSGWMDPASW